MTNDKQNIENALALNLDQFESLLDNDKPNEVDSLLLKMTAEKQSTVDIDTVAFETTTINGKRIYKAQTYVQWVKVGDKNAQPLFQIPLPIAIRGFIIKAKDGYVLWPSDETKKAMAAESKDNAGTVPPPICHTVSCEVRGEVFPSKTPSPFPLSRYQSSGKASSVPRSEIVDLKLMGSRGESCADCIFAGRNKDGTKECDLDVSILFAVTEIGKRSSNAEGIEWLPVTELKDDDGNKVYDKPVIIYIQSSKTAHGSGNKNTVWDNVAKTSYGISTNANGGPKHIPSDVQLFYPYWNTINQEGLVTSTNIHPKLPYTVKAYTEMYLATPEKGVAYLNSLPVFRTVSSVNADPTLRSKLLESIKLYIEGYETYKTEHNVDDTTTPMIRPQPQLAKPMVNITAQTELNSVSPDDEESQPLIHLFKNTLTNTNGTN